MARFEDEQEVIGSDEVGKMEGGGVLGRNEESEEMEKKA